MAVTSSSLPQPDSFAAGLRAWREACHLSRAALAEQAHCSVAMLRQIEAGRRRPSPGLAAQLVRALGLPADAHPAFIAWARGDAAPTTELLLPPTQPRNAMLHLPPLPVNLPSFVGREAEVRAVAAAVNGDTVRLATLTGPGGVGKTRLALAAAEVLKPAFPDGVAFVALAALTDPALVPSEIARVLGVPEAADQPLLTSLQAALRDQRLLLVLDNFEQVRAGAGPVGDLLAGCPSIRALVTSREPLHLPGETVQAVLPLAVPDPAHLPPLAQFSESAAVALFVARAQAHRPDFALTAENAPAVAAICARLDGLPLALELAAARVRLLSPTALLAHLPQPLDLLRDPAGRRPARHQTLRAAIAWSYDLLNPPEQAVFRRLAVFAGGGELEAVTAVVESSGPMLFTVLTSLTDKSLIKLENGGANHRPAARPGRIILLETIRQYALEQLQAHGEEAATRQAHAAHFLTLAEAAEPQLEGPDRPRWLAHLEAEHDNFRAALDWTLAHDPPLALRLAGALWSFWWGQGHWQEGRTRLAQVLAANPAPSPARAKALQGAGTLAYYQGDFPTARRHHEAGLAIYQAHGDASGIARLLLDVGSNWRDAGDYHRAQAMFHESLARYRAANHDPGIARALLWLADFFMQQGEFEAARPFLAESLARYRTLGQPQMLITALSLQGDLARLAGAYDSAAALYSECLALCRESGERIYVPVILHNLGFALLESGQARAAQAAFTEGMTIAVEQQARIRTVCCLAGLGAVYTALQQPEHAARLFSASHTLLADAPTKLDAIDVAAVARYTHQAQAQLAPDQWEAAWAASQAWTLPRALQYVRQIAQSDTRSVTNPAGAQPEPPLSPRESEVLDLLALGLSNEQVAARLYITVKTVESHTRAIYRKLGVASRAAATRLALDRRRAGNNPGPDQGFP